MKYEITYSCGHTGTVALFGPTKDRERRIAYLKERGECPECKAARAQREREEAAARDAEMELPALVGSDKQIVWASQLRLGFIDDILGIIDKSSYPADKIEMVYAARDHILLARNSARWWIENRGQYLLTMKETIIALQTSDEPQVQSERDSPAEASAVITPEQQTQDGVVKIVVEEDTIRGYYPRNDAFRAVVTALHYRWDRDARAWVRKITKFAGPVADRAAELGNRLLLAGFAVSILDAELRRRAVNAEYEPECRRWITLYTSGSYAGNLCVSWDREDDLFARIHAIHGARWDSGTMTVPIESWDEALDMAELLGFRVSEKAMAAIEEYRGHLSPAVKPAAASAVKEPDRLRDILNSPSGVIADLADDEG